MTKDLLEIYARLKKIMKKYEDPLVARFDLDSKYDLWSEKDLVIEGRKKKEVYFAGLIIQSRYVGFYFMPVYVEKELTKVFEPELLKLKKGKSCFHVKLLDEALEQQIDEALQKGYKLYQDRGWV